MRLLEDTLHTKPVTTARELHTDLVRGVRLVLLPYSWCHFFHVLRRDTVVILEVPDLTTQKRVRKNKCQGEEDTTRS